MSPEFIGRSSGSLVYHLVLSSRSSLRGPTQETGRLDHTRTGDVGSRCLCRGPFVGRRVRGRGRTVCRDFSTRYGEWLVWTCQGLYWIPDTPHVPLQHPTEGHSVGDSISSRRPATHPSRDPWVWRPSSSFDLPRLPLGPTSCHDWCYPPNFYPTGRVDSVRPHFLGEGPVRKGHLVRPLPAPGPFRQGSRPRGVSVDSEDVRDVVVHPFDQDVRTVPSPSCSVPGGIPRNLGDRPEGDDRSFRGAREQGPMDRHRRSCVESDPDCRRCPTVKESLLSKSLEHRRRKGGFRVVEDREKTRGITRDLINCGGGVIARSSRDS